MIKPDYMMPEQATPVSPQPAELNQGATALTAQLERYKASRLNREQYWLSCWQNYLGTPTAIRDLRNFNLMEFGGDASTYWRHRLHKPKAFEAVETIVGYLQSAFFPNREYVTLTPTLPGVAELEPVVTKFFLNKLEECQLKTMWALFLRQMAITGNSMIALPWRKEARPIKVKRKVEAYSADGLISPSKTSTQQVEHIYYDAPEFDVVNVFDYWLDPNNPNPQNGNMFRRLRRTKGELLVEVERGMYKHLQPGHVMSAPSTTSIESKGKDVRRYMGEEWHPDEEVELYEFWGDLDTGTGYYRDVCVILLGSTVAKFEHNPFWGGKPFILGTYTPVVDTPYGVGVLEPILGALHELDSITNQRLDNAELSINGMYTHKPDGILRTEDIYVEPGRVLQVGDHATLQPLATPNVNFNVSYQEAQILEQDIDKATGTGAFISVGQGRTGERVTAEEIQATREAGGNRLTAVYTWVETSAFTPLLNKVWQSIRQFVTDDQVIRVPVNTPDGPSYMFIELEPTDLSQDYAVKPRGAGHIADKEFELNKRLQFLELVGANPDMATQLNWVEVMKDLAGRFGYDDFDRYIKPEEPEPEPGALPPTEGLPPGAEGLLPQGSGVPFIDEFTQQQAAIGNAPQLAEDSLVNTGAATPEEAAEIAEVAARL